MARSRKKRRKSGSTPLMIGLGVGVILLAAFVFVFIKMRSEKAVRPGGTFSTTEYISKVSSTAGNILQFKAEVKSVDAKGKRRFVDVLTEDNVRIPLLIPEDAALDSNVRASMTYLFTVESCDGEYKDADGQVKPVKELLIVKSVESAR